MKSTHMEGPIEGNFANISITGTAQTRPAYSPMCAKNVEVTTQLHSAKNSKYMKFNNSAMKVHNTKQPQTQYCAAAQVDTERVLIE